MNRSAVQLVIFVAAAFCLNFVWESWHAAYLYAGFNDGVQPIHAVTFGDFVHLISYVSMVDATILTVVFLGGTLIWRKWEWFSTMDGKKYAYFVTAAILWAICIEYKAVFMFNHWAYSSMMPTVLGLGVSPLAQLAVTGLGALWVVRQVEVKKSTEA